MGRIRLKIQKLKTASARQITFSKRKRGIFKKARELSILCDVDVGLVMFSPTGKPMICLGPNTDLCEVLEKYSGIDVEERSKRKLETLEVLQRTFRKLDHEVDVPMLLRNRIKEIEELRNKKALLLDNLVERNKELSTWTYPENIENLNQVKAMEEAIWLTLDLTRKKKAELEESIVMKLLNWQQEIQSAVPDQGFVRTEFHEGNIKFTPTDMNFLWNTIVDVVNEDRETNTNIDVHDPFCYLTYNAEEFDDLKLNVDVGFNLALNFDPIGFVHDLELDSPSLIA